MKFTNAIVKTPATTIAKGITSVDLGRPIYDKAIQQHQNYVTALKQIGLNVTILNSDDRYPDSCFIEDVALCTPQCVIITQPGAESRKGEIDGLAEHLSSFYKTIETIESPGTVEAGDIMMVGDRFYIGLSDRTNENGAIQMKTILKKYNLDTVFVEMKEMLHLKTGLSYLEHNNLLVSGEFKKSKLFDSFNKIEIEDDEAYAANCIWVNDHILIPSGFPNTFNKMKSLGYTMIEIDMSEFQKIDGGLSCLSLRF
jgi:dimethylargininase